MMNSMCQKNKQAKKLEKVLEKQIYSDLLKELDDPKKWFIGVDNHIKHKENNICISEGKKLSIHLYQPLKVKFSLIKSIKIRHRLKIIKQVEKNKNLQFVIDVVCGKYPIYENLNNIACKKWLYENDPEKMGYVIKNGNIYFTDQSLAVAYKLSKK